MDQSIWFEDIYWKGQNRNQQTSTERMHPIDGSTSETTQHDDDTQQSLDSLSPRQLQRALSIRQEYAVHRINVPAEEIFSVLEVLRQKLAAGNNEAPSDDQVRETIRSITDNRIAGTKDCL